LVADRRLRLNVGDEGVDDPRLVLALPVASLAAKDCRLFLWTPDSHLPQALALGIGWGFEYSTIAFTWAKLTNPSKPRKPCKKCGARKQVWHFGGGHWTRKNPEMCLAFLRGNLNRRSASVRQLVIEPRCDEHSRKPAEVYERIERLVDGPYLEMFARPPHRPGWTGLGRRGTGTSIGADTGRAAGTDSSLEDSQPALSTDLLVPRLAEKRQVEREDRHFEVVAHLPDDQLMMQRDVDDVVEDDFPDLLDHGVAAVGDHLGVDLRDQLVDTRGFE